MFPFSCLFLANIFRMPILIFCMSMLNKWTCWHSCWNSNIRSDGKKRKKFGRHKEGESTTTYKHHTDTHTHTQTHSYIKSDKTLRLIEVYALKRVVFVLCACASKRGVISKSRGDLHFSGFSIPFIAIERWFCLICISNKKKNKNI